MQPLDKVAAFPSLPFQKRSALKLTRRITTTKLYWKNG